MSFYDKKSNTIMEYNLTKEIKKRDYHHIHPFPISKNYSDHYYNDSIVFTHLVPSVVTEFPLFVSPIHPIDNNICPKYHLSNRFNNCVGGFVEPKADPKILPDLTIYNYIKDDYMVNDKHNHPLHINRRFHDGNEYITTVMKQHVMRPIYNKP